ncbi:glk, partial [Symbiodinium sp. CCMP2592]
MKLNDAEPVQNGTIACIGAGTGLGQCFLVADTQTGDYTCHPSEGQHGEFGPRGAGSDELKLELLKYLKIKFSNAGNRISTERVVSGTGICNIYEFLAYKHPHEVDEEVHEAHNDRPKDAGIIAMNAKPGSLCEKTMKIFADAYGAQCATFALYVQPFGGIYITGGVTKKMREWLLKEGSFMKAYYDKGRLTPVLNRVPLMIVEGDDMGQRGAHLRAVMLLKQEIREQARRLFDTLDFNNDGLLFVGELEGLFEMAGDKAGKHRHELARQLLQELDSNHDGHLDFEEFLKGYAKLPTKMISESPFLHREREVQKEPKMDRTQLVSPPDRGNDVDSQAALAKELQKYQSRSRREKIDPFKDANAPVFQTRLYKLLADHDRTKEESWVPRMYWVSNS